MVNTKLLLFYYYYHITNLFASVDDVLGKRETAGTGPADHGMVARRGVGHLHGAEL